MNPEQELFSIFDLKDFTLKNYSGKIKQDVKSSIEPFWMEYFGVKSRIPFFEMNDTINKCLKDLTIKSAHNKDDLKNKLHLTPQRSKNYPNIDSMLKSQGIHEKDRIVTLDGHDFACRSNNPIDFVTFDNDCFNGTKNVEILCFNSIKGKDDFTAS